MKLSEIVKFLDASGASPLFVANENYTEPDITDVFSDSRNVVSGSIFCCINGAEADGHKFARAAQEAGAAALLVERRIEDCSLPQIIVRSTRAWMGEIAAQVYGEPCKKLKMFAVTGTNGKTTTTWIIRNLLESLGMKCGIIGTIIQSDGNETWDAERTTPESCDVQRLLARMVRNGCRACVMETSSHGLFLGRLDACFFDVMLFTNLNPEHLDFHKDMESYFAAKKLLFDKHAKKNSKIIANADDEYGEKIIASYSDVFSFGFGKADISAENLRLGLDGSKFSLKIGGESMGEFSSPLVAEFNVRNTLGAIAAVYEKNIDIDALREGVASTPQVPGRLEKHFIPINGDPKAACCIIDFAHTPEALRNVLSAVREFCSKKLVSVFGHGGGRYQANRPTLGATASSVADKIIITMDNPRNENPADIADQIAEGTNSDSEIEIILNRSEAIKKGIDGLAPGDVMVLSGKGPEKYLTVGTTKIPYSDAGEVQKIVRTGTFMPIPCRLALDSREVTESPPCGFVALVGEKTDGHLYIEQAVEGGAKFVVGKPGRRPEALPAHIPYIALDETEKGLALLARAHIERVAPLEIIAITGSVGKTTTREATRRVLEKKYRVHSAERSFNTLIGCAVSILNMPEGTEILLLEFGANKPCEILELTQFFAPTFSIITEVAPVHLEGFKTLEGVLRGKMEITKSERLRKFLYNFDNALLRSAAEKIRAKLISVGRGEGADYTIKARYETYSLPLEWELLHGDDEPLRFSGDLWGTHIMFPMSMAAAIGAELGVPKQKIEEAIGEYEALGGRGKIIRKNGKIIIDDAYNANPASMTASLSAFLALDSGAKCAILGDMRELGDGAGTFHRDIISLVRAIERVVLVGSLWNDALGDNFPQNCVWFADWQTADEYMKNKNDWEMLLVKGSNSHKLQKLVAVTEQRL